MTEVIQFGRPEQIYNEPPSPFAARFTGLAGEVPVRVAAADSDGTVELEPAGSGLLRSFRARASGGRVPEGEAVLLIRPTGARLCDPDEPDYHLGGTVADVAFRGRGYEHAIDIHGHGRLAGIFASSRADRGAPVGLRLDDAGCHVFPVEPASQAAEPADPDPAAPTAVPA